MKCVCTGPEKLAQSLNNIVKDISPLSDESVLDTFFSLTDHDFESLSDRNSGHSDFSLGQIPEVSRAFPKFENHSNFGQWSKRVFYFGKDPSQTFAIRRKIL
jgi:hypothetical protein